MSFENFSVYNLSIDDMIVIITLVTILCLLYFIYYRQPAEKFTNDNTLLPIDIQGYETFDGGVTIKWSKPVNSTDYMTVLKDMTDNTGIKLYFSDDVKVDCIDNTCSYSFENLVTDHEYSLSIAYIDGQKMSPMSKVLKFMPTVAKMQCNANGTCNIVNKDNVVLKDIPITDNNTKQLLSKCKKIVDSTNAMSDITKIYNADGSFGAVKDELQYPEHLILPIENGPNSLSELIKRQLEMGILNINIHTKPQS